MTPPLHIKTRVLPGHRIELSTPELPEGETVNVIVTSENSGTIDEAGISGELMSSGRNVLEFFRSLPAGPRSYASWDEFEEQFKKERDSWDR